MFEDFMTIDMLTTFAGITTAVIVIVQVSILLVKKRFGYHFVRLYSFLISLILIGVFTNDNFNIQEIIHMIINSTMVTIASIGGYEMLVDPMPQKTRS